MQQRNTPPQSSAHRRSETAPLVGLSIVEDYNSLKVPVNKSASEWVTVAQIRNNQVLTYSINIERTRTGSQLQALENSRQRNKFPGDISKHSRKKITRICHCWIEAINSFGNRRQRRAQAAARCLGFVTLTLSSKQKHTDNWVKRHMLNRFLIELTRYHGVKNYLWRAEKQKNGNVHFHILIDKYVEWQVLRMQWNEIQKDCGYMEEFTRKHGHSNPNSTDIHSLKSVRNPAAYITKYMTKNSPKLRVQGRVWSASRKLAECRYFEFHPDETFWGFAMAYKQDWPEKTFEGECFTLYQLPVWYCLKFMGTGKAEEYTEYYREMAQRLAA